MVKILLGRSNMEATFIAACNRFQWHCADTAIVLSELVLGGKGVCTGSVELRPMSIAETVKLSDMVLFSSCRY